MNEWRRFARHRLALVGLGVIVALSLLALAARGGVERVNPVPGALNNF